MERVPLQIAVRATRAKLAEAWQRRDLEGVATCIAELRTHADRAEREAGRADEATVMLRQLADEHEALRAHRALMTGWPGPGTPAAP